jgi:hypothetical protein
VTYFANIFLVRYFGTYLNYTLDTSDPDIHVAFAPALPPPKKVKAYGFHASEGYYAIPSSAKASHIEQYVHKARNRCNGEVGNEPNTITVTQGTAKAAVNLRGNRANTSPLTQGLEQKNILRQALANSFTEDNAGSQADSEGHGHDVTVHFNQLQSRKKQSQLREARFTLGDCMHSNELRRATW